MSKLELTGCHVPKGGYEGDLFVPPAPALRERPSLNNSSRSRANMGTAVIYFCRLLEMALSIIVWIPLS